eukprot:CAMPEP_0202978266 /NCGR_PEP_ID=MMETSP1396-20130829/84748_1 /ASSEMBLY_ACC=CAM_ASM_000872 /TAXON_ID= /ORGANISM="Pseudokeronopsis sp., Strain Brazil" /LENGTH=111 /DNA_ID=CAMNT_0049717183 /DNA_START=2276 /DNA_END=2611 /DNA_ORIENTATION=-
MISIFEVFAQNRNETDFIENLELYGTIAMEQQEDDLGGDEEEEEEEDLSDPNVKTLHEFKEQMGSEEYSWGKEQIGLQNKKLLMILNVYNQMKDANDFLHSFKRLYNMAKK